MYADDIDRTSFCNRLALVIKQHDWICHAFCLMTTHYHLLVEVADNALQPGMQALNGPYAQRFNARHRRRGHLRGDRYYAGAVVTDGHMLSLLRYLAWNPVDAGLCQRPADWCWGSYRGCAGIDDGFPFIDSSRLRGYFGGDDQKALELLRAFVGDSLTVPLPGSVPVLG
jgi:putative transposase